MAQLNAISHQVGGWVRQLHLTDCGHAPHRDHPDAVSVTITDFVASLV